MIGKHENIWNDKTKKVLGDNCDSYRTNRYCSAGMSMVGEKYNYPELNCCGCENEKQGKKNKYKCDKKYSLRKYM